MSDSSRSFTQMISGKRWRIIFVDPQELPDNHMGDCDIISRRIRIALGMSEQETKETILHEIAHAAVWDLDEEAIVRVANAQARALTKANFFNQALLHGGKNGKS
ncbi:hypothetical protein EBZ39_03080 [bacterium]|nr:hypothetical protein [bacterium]